MVACLEPDARRVDAGRGQGLLLTESPRREEVSVGYLRHLFHGQVDVTAAVFVAVPLMVSLFVGLLIQVAAKISVTARRERTHR